MKNIKKLLVGLFVILLLCLAYFLVLKYKTAQYYKLEDQKTLIYVEQQALEFEDYESVLDSKKQILNFIKELKAQKKELHYKYTLKACPNLETYSSQTASRANQIEGYLRKYLHKKLKLYSVFQLEKEKYRTKCEELKYVGDNGGKIDHILVINRFNFKDKDSPKTVNR